MRPEPIRCGADLLAAEGFSRLRGQRVGLVCNQSAVLHPGLEHLADAMARAVGVELVALFAPEHGIRGEAQDMESVESARDAVLDLPIHSLYGSSLESLSPRSEDLEGLDCLVFDVQDIGSRYYTFAATLVLCMRQCARLGIRLLVLDRPNPLGGREVEGGTVDPGFESFVGLTPMPVRHGLTVAEIASLTLAREGLSLELDLLLMEGWQAAHGFEETGLHFIPPSPNMPTLDTAWVYPGLCLIEATELSEGRGTTRPFEQLGAPGLDARRLRLALTEEDPLNCCQGVVVREACFRPAFQKSRLQSCAGVFLHVQDATVFSAWRLGQHLLHTLWRVCPEQAVWRRDAYEFVERIPAIDLLAGSADLRLCVEGQSSVAALFEKQEAAAARFKEERQAHLLYPR